MRLYEGTSQKFVEDASHNKVADLLTEAYEEYYGHRPGPSEINSWTNSLQFLKNIITENQLLNNMIVIEYELPYSNSRVDCILFGKSKDDKDNVALIELKQWSSVDDCDVEGNIITFVGGAKRMVAHPSMQVKNYHEHIQDFIELFHDEKTTSLSSCVYLHNYTKQQNDPLFSTKFSSLYTHFPLFTKNDFKEIGEYLKDRLSNGQGVEVFNKFASSNIRPSKKLLEHTRHMIEGQQVFHLIDDQLTANNTIIDRALKCTKLSRKSVIIVRGGPGTGKSVIALNAVAELLSKGKTVFHATGSSAFTKTLRKIVGTRAGKFFKFFDSFTTHAENELDVLICDEAHRIRKTSASRYRRGSGLPQIDEIMKAARTAIFFIDDYQIVRPTEIGSTKLLLDAAQKFNADVYDFDLKTQFRCSGSNGYINWIDNTLNIRETANPFLSKTERMEFKIFDSPTALYEAIKAKNTEKANSARVAAGYCWQWNDPLPDGSLPKDVVIGDFKMPWEDKKNFWKWATEDEGMEQVGTVYTAQGFEFDFIGVIFANDIIYDPEKKDWAGRPENSSDPLVKKAKDDYLKYVKNIYRVLLTRGMKGCYVYFMDKNTEEFFRSRIQQN